MNSFEYDSETTNALVKRVYDKYYKKDQFNARRVLEGMVDRKVTFVGSQIEKAFLRSLGGGVSAGGVPKTSTRRYSKGTVTSKKSIAAVDVDYESWLATSNSTGAFVSFQSEALEQLKDNLLNNLERQLVRNGAAGKGILVAGNAANPSADGVTGAGTTASPYVIKFTASDAYFPAAFESIEEGHSLNVVTGSGQSEAAEDTTLEVTVVDVTMQPDGYATAEISLVGTSAGYRL